MEIKNRTDSIVNFPELAQVQNMVFIAMERIKIIFQAIWALALNLQLPN